MFYRMLTTVFQILMSIRLCSLCMMDMEVNTLQYCTAGQSILKCIRVIQQTVFPLGEEVALYCSKYLPDIIKEQKAYKDGKLQKVRSNKFNDS